MQKGAQQQVDASADSDRTVARPARSVYHSVAGRVSKLSDRVTSGVGKAKDILTRSSRTPNGGSLQQPAGGTPGAAGRRSVPVPHTEGHKALFVEEVVYATPRLIGTRRDKGLLIINGAEMAIIRLQAQQPASSGNATAAGSDGLMAAGSSDTAVATVLVQHQLSKLIAVRQEGKVLSLEFAKSASAKFTCKAEAFGFNCDDLSPAAAAAAAMAAERSGSSDSELARVYSPPPASGRVGYVCEASDFAPGTSPGGLEASASAVSLGLEGSSYSNSNRDGMEFAMQFIKESRTLKTVKGLASSIRIKSTTEEEEGECHTRRLRAPNGREYRVQIDEFRLSFNDTTCAELALKLMAAGRQRMLKALSWLKRGLPFTHDSEISHVTQADAYRGGAEVLLSGPTLWGTQLQLPPGWVEAVLAAEPPEEGLTLQDLQVSQGPAAFKVYLSTPAGMAVAHLTPGLLADIWHSSSREGDILAVPVGANLTQMQQQQGSAAAVQGNGLGPRAASRSSPSQPAAEGGVSARSPQKAAGMADGRHASHNATDDSNATAPMNSSRVGDCNGLHRAASPGLQRPGALLQPTCSFRVGQMEDLVGQAAGAPNTAGAAAVIASVVGDLDGSSSSSSTGRELHAGQGSQRRQAAGSSSASGTVQPATTTPSRHSSPSGSAHYRRASMPAVVVPESGMAGAATGGTAAGASDDSLLQHLSAEGRPLGRSKSDRALCKTASKASAAASASAAGSGSSSPRGLAKSRLGAHSSSARHLGEVSGGSSSSLAAAAAAAVGSTSSSRARGAESGGGSSSAFDLQASFADVSEVFAVIKVRMYTVEDGEVEAPAAGAALQGDAAGSYDSDNEDVVSPFAASAGGSPRKLDAMAPGRAASVIRSHSVASAARVPFGRQHSTASSSASRRDAYGVMSRNVSGLMPDSDAGDEDGSTSMQPTRSVVLCSTSGTRSTTAPALGLGRATQQQVWSMLSVAAVLLCLASMLTGGLTTLLGCVLLVGAVALNLLLLATSWRPQVLLRLWEAVVQLAGASQRKGRSAKQLLLRNTSSLRHSIARTAGGTPQPSGSSQAVHLELIRAVFVRDSMGLLEKQQIMYRAVYGLGTTERQLTAEEVEQLRAASGGLDEGDLDRLVVLISDPEPDWMTPDWKRRLIVARPTQEERQALARSVHQFRAKVQADTLLSRPPGHWATFQAAFHYALLGMSPQGAPVLMLKVAMLSGLPGELKRAGRSLEEFVEHMTFVWSFMFQELATAPHPGGRYILVIDLAGMRSLSHMSSCKAAGNYLGEVMGSFPERLCRCMVVNAPSWFNLIWRLVSPCMAEKTRAKVQVLTSEQELVQELGRCVGADWVPAEYGGPCRLPYGQYPVQQQLNKYAAQLANGAS